MSETEIQERFHRVKEVERAVPRTLIRVEKKIVHFPFRRYFLGHQKPEEPQFKPDWKTWSDDALTLAWLGQSTVLINFYGTWILTDPVMSERCGIGVGPITIGPRRMVGAPLRVDELPPLDLILISHAHMDHTDVPTLQSIRNFQRANGKESTVIVAENTLQVYQSLDFKDLRELDWNERAELISNSKTETAEPVTIEAIETRHAGWRMPWQPCRARNETNGMSYNAYLVEKNIGRAGSSDLRAFVFGGDTGYIKSFHVIGERMRLQGREIECAIMPIGTYNPWGAAHANPEEAWRMTREMNARVIVPIHWNSFLQSSEPRYEPIEWLQAVVEDSRSIALTEHGETWNSG